MAAIPTQNYPDSTSLQGTIVQPASDGIWDRYNVFQGVRTYDPHVGAWTSPDALAGTVDDPASQAPYIWNRNNPSDFADPSGYRPDDPEEQLVGQEAYAAAEAQALEEQRAEQDAPGYAEPQAGPALLLSEVKAALREVYRILGGRLPKGPPGKFGSPQRTLGKKGYRLDPGHPGHPPGHPEAGPHINYWDWSGGKRSSGGGISGAIPIGGRGGDL